MCMHTRKGCIFLDIKGFRSVSCCIHSAAEPSPQKLPQSARLGRRERLTARAAAFIAATLFCSASLADGTPQVAAAEDDSAPVAATRPTVQTDDSSQPRISPVSEEPKPRPLPEVPVAAKVRRYAAQFVTRHDSDGDGQLGPKELNGLPDGLRNADYSADGFVTTEELAASIAEYGLRRRMKLSSPPPDNSDNLVDGPNSGGQETQPRGDTPAATNGPDGEPTRRRDTKFFVPSNRLPKGLPAWFVRLDRNGDGQLTISEFAPKGRQADIARFRKYDANGDGVVTAKECTRAPNAQKQGEQTKPAQTR